MSDSCACAGVQPPSGSQESVIRHLLGQLRIGMDLSRITLPTYILEKRSALEMYSEFVHNADLFAECARCPPLHSTAHLLLQLSCPSPQLTAHAHALSRCTLCHCLVARSIATAPEPTGRMLALLRWYLSAFYAMRRSSVPKKPYNPVLGEYFQCCWPLTSAQQQPQSSSSSSSSRCVLLVWRARFQSRSLFSDL